MVIKTNISGVMSRLKGIGRALNKEISDANGDFMRGVKKSAKLRAPRDTLRMKDSIRIIKTKNGWDLEVTSRYAYFQEMGFRPHWIHSDMIDESRKLTRYGFFFVKKSKPFVRPALDHNLKGFSRILKSATKQAIAKKGG